jgi:hypothetical protein
MKEFIKRLKFCWWFLFAPKRMQVVHLDIFLALLPGDVMAKIKHEARNWRIIEFAVKMPKAKTRGVWGK